MSNLPEKFTIPKDRIPKPWSQGLYNLCVSASITKCLEVINYVKTGTYTMMSKGYTYAKHSRPDKTQGGMDYEYAMNSLLKHGTVPEEMFPILDEIPDIMDKLRNHPNIVNINTEAEKTKIKDFTKIKGDIRFYENVKKCIYEHQMPLVGNMVGKRHSAVIVGWDGDELLYQDHDGRDRLVKGKFNEAYYLDGGINEINISDEKEGDNIMTENFKNFKTVAEFEEYIRNLNVCRSISKIQMHHTYSPSYKQFTGSNHESLQRGMQKYHIETNGWADIGQHFTIFPDGTIMTGRNINTVPAGIKGANTGAICIECLGNFDKGGDTMTEAQKNAIVGVVKILADRYGLNVSNDVVYHAWYTSDGRNIGDYFKSDSVKTCPGTNFFGGNGFTAFMDNFVPLVENYGKKEVIDMANNNTLKPVESINDIVWELTNANIITNGEFWMKKCEEDINVYWLCRKMANKLRGTLE